MEEFFASIYEWWGLNPIYSLDMAEHLRGWDITCSAYIGTHWYVYVGVISIIIICFIYALQYHIIDSPRFMRKYHWWLMACLISALNYFIAFIIPFNSIQSLNFCTDLNLTIADCFGFGMTNAIWSFIFFTIITSIPWIRRLSRNCAHTTFWRP